MYFLGATFCSWKRALVPPITNVNNVTEITIRDGEYNELFATKDPNATVNNFNDEWNYDTIMDAKFEGNADAGNSGFSLRTTDHIVIRRREKGKTEWLTLYVKQINIPEDFNINFVDRTASNHKTYEYCISSYLNGAENSYEIQEIDSEFEGWFIMSKDEMYGTGYNPNISSFSREVGGQVLNMNNSKYASFVSNSIANYDTGSASGSFLQLDEYGLPERNAQLDLQNKVKDVLMSRKPLILKSYDGHSWIIKVMGSVTDEGEHPDLRTISFEWVQIGEPDNIEHLYDLGLTDIESRWW